MRVAKSSSGGRYGRVHIPVAATATVGGAGAATDTTTGVYNCARPKSAN